MAQIKLDPEKLREARFDAGYSLRELAPLVNQSHARLWEYEKGRRSPQPRTIRKLAEVLGVTPGELRER